MKNRPEFNESLMHPDTLRAFYKFSMLTLNKSFDREIFIPDYSFLIFVDRYLHPFEESYEFLKLLANALRYDNKAALIEVFELEYGTAKKLLNHYYSRIKENKLHPRRAKKSQHLLTFKDTGEIDAFEFKNPPDPLASINSRRHVPFTPYQDEE